MDWTRVTERFSAIELALMALCAVLTFAIGYESIAGLEEPAVPSVALHHVSHLGATQESFSPPAIGSFGAIDEHPLFLRQRRPPPPPEAIAKAAAPPPPPNVFLVGVISDAHGSIALLRTPASPLEMSFTVGSKIDGWQVVSISPDRVLLRSGAANDELRLNAEHPGGSSQSHPTTLNDQRNGPRG